MKFILFSILFFANISKAATVMEWQEVTFTNILKNPGFENGIAKWTPSVSATFQIVSGSQALIETRSASFTATAASQTVQSALYPLPLGLANTPCEAQVLYQTNSSVYRMRVLNTSGTLVSQKSLPPVSSPTVERMSFTCPTSATLSLRIDVISSATAAGAAITWDQNHLGSFAGPKVMSSGNTIERFERGRIGGAANETTTCTTSPCTIHRQSGGVSSVSRTSTGNYTINFPVGIFSGPPSCTFNMANGATTVVVSIAAASTLTYSMTFNIPGGATTDVYFDYVCGGPR